MGEATIVDDTTATFNISGDMRKGDSVVVTYKIINNSKGIGADIDLSLINSNTEYYQVTETITDKQLQAGEATTATVTVEMIENPFEINQSTTITAKLIANPVDDEIAISNDPKSVKSPPDPESFATDSWTTIKKAVRDNNTSLYHIGDTKEVEINEVNYTVRLANKSSHDWCDNEVYSETACGFVIEFVDDTSEMKLKTDESNNGGYPATAAYTYLNEELINILPTDLKKVIASTRVISGHNISESTNYVNNKQKLYLLSGVEVYGSDPDDTASSTTTQLDYYRNNNVNRGSNISYTIKYYNSENWRWWLRTPNYSDYGYNGVSKDGYLRHYYPNNSDRGGIAPAFRIA